jgi:hypothetical protein
MPRAQRRCPPQPQRATRAPSSSSSSLRRGEPSCSAGSVSAPPARESS